MTQRNAEHVGLIEPIRRLSPDAIIGVPIADGFDCRPTFQKDHD